MATSKTRKKKPADKNQAAVTGTYDPNKDRRALEALLARHGAVTPEHRAAFEDLVTDARRVELGNRTRAVGVFPEAVAWGVIISKAFNDYPAALAEHYSPERFTFYLHCAKALDTAIQAQATERGDQVEVTGTAVDRETAARKARKTLIAKCRGFAGGREAELEALRVATGNTEDTNALGGSIRALVKLAQEWVARPDMKSKIQASSAGLRQDVIEAALLAAEALTGAATAATLAGKRAGVDSPAANLAEGGMLIEMDEVMRCFEEARRETPLLPRLTPGSATRHMLGARRPKKEAEVEAEGEGEETPPVEPEEEEEDLAVDGA